jgi:hypothetical protein
LNQNFWQYSKDYACYRMDKHVDSLRKKVDSNNGRFFLPFMLDLDSSIVL